MLPEQANRVQAIGELALELPQENDRHYPQGSMAAHVPAGNSSSASDLIELS